jgi:hypothetical protein
MTLLAALELEGNGFTAASVVGCEGWREAGLPPAAEDFCSVLGSHGYDGLIQYAVSRDRAAVAARYHPLLPAALLRRIESSDPSLTSVDIAGSAGDGDASKYMGSSRVACLAEALCLNTCITSLNVAGNRLGSAGLRTLMGGVTRLTGLTSLNLGRNELSADDGARVCGAAAAAGMTLLAALELEGNGFTAASVVGCEGWREAGLCCSWDLVFFPQSFDVLIRYALSSDRAAVAEANRHPLLPAALLRRIESSDPSLTSVVIKGLYESVDASFYIGSSCVVALAEALCLNTCITSLNVAGNRLGSAGLRTLMGGVTRLTGLTSLDISANDMSSDGVVHVTESFVHLTSLTSVNLFFNGLTANDAVCICNAAAAAGMTRLQKLNLEANGFKASSVVDCDEWRKLGLPQPPDEIVRQGFDSLIQYLLSENKVATNAIRIFVVGESTVRCFTACDCCARSSERCFVFEIWLFSSHCFTLVCCAGAVPLTPCAADGQDVARARAHVLVVQMRAHRPRRQNRWHRPSRSAAAGSQPRTKTTGCSC